ncbi:hypothetical protein TNCT_361621 [Trichonephila clavata]|uniref:Uncharacterized protein n=1 Tax=Trichonephila clavata TaxID=2740835 RepID=A0A8X6GM40_TRICU|nr:hypothetical protein TNCT_361621 [Trichonephila clavata]
MVLFIIVTYWNKSSLIQSETLPQGHAFSIPNFTITVTTTRKTESGERSSSSNIIYRGSEENEAQIRGTKSFGLSEWSALFGGLKALESECRNLCGWRDALSINRLLRCERENMSMAFGDKSVKIIEFISRYCLYKHFWITLQRLLFKIIMPVNM